MYSFEPKGILALKFLGSIEHSSSVVVAVAHQGDINLRCMRALALAVALTLDK